MAGFGRDRQLRIENLGLWGICTTFVLCSQYVLFRSRALAPFRSMIWLVVPLDFVGWPFLGLERAPARVHFRPYEKDEWYETLRCPTCGKTGKASLSQDGEDASTIDLVPDGFRVIDTEHGPNFHCETCEVAVKP
jgi:hypothetical protein